LANEGGIYKNGMFSSATESNIVLKKLMMWGPPETMPALLQRKPSVVPQFPTISVAIKSHLARMIVGTTLASMMAATTWATEAISIQNIQGLSFGSFVARSGGSVTVSANGNRTASGAMLVPSNQGRAAQFRVSGKSSNTYTIQLPGNDFVSLTGPGEDMIVNNFTSTPSNAGGDIPQNGSQVLFVGGMLNVASGQVRGQYSGNFSVTVNYN
jgi:hypothetical protein